ncbi:MAG: hypothetical protein FWD11_06355, partial [Micrococcales bacterium]|nr:hypothetical protein [Micrococcales bacterium]
MHQLKGTDGELARRTELTRTHKHRKAWANACARYVLIPVVSVFVLVIGLVAALLAPGTPATLAAPLPVPPPPNADVPELSTRPVVLLGTAGLRWSDVSQTATPTLAQLAETWAVGNVAVHTTHTTTCPADGWLTVAAGARASDLVADRCRALDGVTAGRVDGWDDYLQAALGRDALPGRFGETLTVAEVPVAGIGPGAAIALARTDGTSPERWVPRPDNPAELTQAVADALKGQTRIVIVDLGVVHDEASAAQVDVALRAALDGAGAADVLVVSLADRPGDGPGLQLIAKGQPGVTSPALLTSASTRQAGLVVTDDVTATLLGLAGMDGDERPAWATGKTIRRVPGEGVAGLVDAAEHASAVRPLVPQFRVGLVAVTSVLVLAVALAWFTTRRVAKSRPDASRWVSWHRRGLRWLTIAGLGAAALPASLLVANLVPWWRAASPPLALGLAAAVVATGIVELALAGPWRRWPAGPAAAVAAVTVAVFVVDVLTGSRMHLSAVLGTQTLVTEYFYGLTTTTFTLTATATAVLVAALAVPLVRSGRRTWAAALGVAAAVGLVVLATVAVAGFGTDAGVGVAAAVAVIGVPLVLAVGTGWLARLPGVATPRSVATPGSADEPASDTSGTGEADRSERRTAALAAAAAAVVALVVTLMLWSAGDVTPQASLTRLVTTVVVVVVAALALAGAAVAVSARRGQVVPPQLRKITVALAVLVGCAPAGALLAGLSRWWAATTPTVVAAMWWAVATASVAAAAWLMSRASTPAPGRLAVWAAALTWLTLTVDQIAGARLAPGSVLVDLAGTYVLAGVGLAAGLGRHLRRNQTRTGKVVALSAVLAVGVVTVEVVGWSVAGQVVLAAAFAVVAVELVAPRRANLLVAAVVALVAVALAGGEGRLAAVVLAVLAAATLMAASTLDHTWRLLADDPPAAAAPAHNGAAVIVATAGALVSLVLLAQVFVPALPQPAGSVTSGRGTPALSADAPVVVVGVSGVGWDAVNPTDTPTLWRLLDAAPAGAVVPGVTGPSRQCPSGGWLAISSGRNVLTGTRSPGVPFSCLPWDTVAQPDGSAVVVGFEELVDLQTTSEYRPHLGAFGQALAASPACTTAVGPRAGLALATPDGTVTRYRPLEAALEEGTDAFDCPLTLVDAGSGAPQPDLGEAATTDSPQGVDTNLPDTTDDAEQDTDPAYQGDQDDQEDDTAAVRRVDQTIGRLLAVIPDEATVLVV